MWFGFEHSLFTINHTSYLINLISATRSFTEFPFENELLYLDAIAEESNTPDPDPTKTSIGIVKL